MPIEKVCWNCDNKRKVICPTEFMTVVPCILVTGDEFTKYKVNQLVAKTCAHFEYSMESLISSFPQPNDSLYTIVKFTVDMEKYKVNNPQSFDNVTIDDHIKNKGWSDDEVVKIKLMVKLYQAGDVTEIDKLGNVVIEKAFRGYRNFVNEFTQTALSARRAMVHLFNALNDDILIETQVLRPKAFTAIPNSVPNHVFCDIILKIPSDGKYHLIAIRRVSGLWSWNKTPSGCNDLLTKFYKE